VWDKRKAKPQKKRKRKSLRSEKRAADDLNGEVTPNSGAARGWFGDVQCDDLLVEDKYRTGHFYLTKDDWKKLEDGARVKGGKIPVFRITVEQCEPVAILNPDDWEEIGGVPPLCRVPHKLRKGRKSFRVYSGLVRILEHEASLWLDTPMGILLLTTWDRFVAAYKEDQ
jgi:hypothetical protein